MLLRAPAMMRKYCPSLNRREESKPAGGLGNHPFVDFYGMEVERCTVKIDTLFPGDGGPGLQPPSNEGGGERAGGAWKEGRKEEYLSLPGEKITSQHLSPEALPKGTNQRSHRLSIASGRSPAPKSGSKAVPRVRPRRTEAPRERKEEMASGE